MLKKNSYWQQWEMVTLVIQQPPPPDPWDTFWQKFASHLAVVLAAGVGAKVLDELLG